MMMLAGLRAKLNVINEQWRCEQEDDNYAHMINEKIHLVWELLREFREFFFQLSAEFC